MSSQDGKRDVPVVLIKIGTFGDYHFWWSYHWSETDQTSLNKLLDALAASDVSFPAQGPPCTQLEEDGSWSIVSGSFVIGEIIVNPAAPQS